MDIVTLAAARAYTKATADQFGAVKGTNCKIIKNEVVGDNTEVTFQWKNDSDETKTTLVKIPNGTQGVSVTAVTVDTDNHLVFTMSDGTTIDGGSFDTQDYLQEELVATVDIGTVTNGKKYPKGTKLESIIRDMLIKEVPPAVTLSLTPSATLYDIVNDSVASIKLTAAVTQKTYPLDKVRFFVEDTEVSTQPASGTGTYQYDYNPDTPITSDTTFKVIVMDTKLSTTVTKKIKFVGKSYYGIGPSDVGEPTGALIKTLNSTLKDVKGYKYAGIITDYGKVIYAYPKSFGDLTSIKDIPGNFDYTSSFAKTVLDVDGIAYNCYTQVDPSAADNVELTFA